MIKVRELRWVNVADRTLRNAQSRSGIQISILSISMLKPGFGFSIDRKEPRKFESVERAVTNSSSLGIFYFSLSIIPAIMQASGVKGTKRPFGSSMVARFSSTFDGAHVRDPENTMGTGTSLYSCVRFSPLLLSHDHTSAAWDPTTARWTILRSSSNSLGY